MEQTFNRKREFPKVTQTSKVIDAQSIEEEGKIEKRRDHSINKTKGSRKTQSKDPKRD